MNLTRFFKLSTFILVFYYLGPCAKALPSLVKSDSEELEAHLFRAAPSSELSTATVAYTSTFGIPSHTSAHTLITPRPLFRPRPYYHYHVQTARQASETSSNSILDNAFSPLKLQAANLEPGWHAHSSIPIPLIIVLVMFTPFVCFVILHHIHTIFKRCREARKAGTNGKQHTIDNAEMKALCEKASPAGKASINSIISLGSSSQAHGFSSKDDSDYDTFICPYSSSSSEESFPSSPIALSYPSRKQPYLSNSMVAPGPLPDIPPRVVYAPFHTAKTKLHVFERFSSTNGKEHLVSEWAVSGLLVPKETFMTGEVAELDDVNMRYK